MTALLPVAGQQTPAQVGLAPVLRFLGMVLCCLAGVMLFPAAMDQANGSPEFQVFVAAAAVTLFIGGALVGAFSGGAPRIGLRQGVLAVILTWIGTILCGALPFLFAEQPLSFTDAIFEATSGLTSTGSTVYVGLDQSSRGILMWRSFPAPAPPSDRR